MSGLEHKIEQAAKILFEADGHSELKAIYRDEGKTLSWHSLNRRNKEKYLRRAKQIVMELAPLYE